MKTISKIKIKMMIKEWAIVNQCNLVQDMVTMTNMKEQINQRDKEKKKLVILYLITHIAKEMEKT